ncbi:hypothetical protein CC80DRAFT_323968 [Byssothecium circinans]|uniref:Hypervirulence associated protein TUDOR domain-containing protein n=1 Tax=Byssothecium circinans TaxID=147558 RepID=A0A6A5U5L5_9PLEO|nr:hypothetical protein CC80DRAFT_323968 [Byssothecium circinans]
MVTEYKGKSKKGKETTDGREKNEHAANYGDTDNTEQQKADKNSKKSATDCTQHWEDEEHHLKGQKEYQKFKEAQNKSEANADSGSTQSEDQGDSKAEKRGRGANPQNGSNKKQKGGGGGSDAPRGAAGDKTRVPKKGQEVQWHALPGYVDGTVVEVFYEVKDFEGKKIRGSKEDPWIVLKSSSSGKIAVHKPEAVYFD